MDTPVTTLARVAMSRWPIETEFEDEKSLVALDEYEVRSWSGWQHHTTMCLLASAFLLTLQQEWGEKAAPDHTAAGVSHRLRTLTAQALDTRRVARLAGADAATECRGQTQSRQAARPRTRRDVEPGRSLRVNSSL